MLQKRLLTGEKRTSAHLGTFRILHPLTRDVHSVVSICLRNPGEYKNLWLQESHTQTTRQLCISYEQSPARLEESFYLVWFSVWECAWLCTHVAVAETHRVRRSSVGTDVTGGSESPDTDPGNWTPGLCKRFLLTARSWASKPAPFQFL